jgi:pyruvate/2-oxoglutarate dehydrogenase complex dihydrolipoamide dehydrogenase (E3) component
MRLLLHRFVSTDPSTLRTDVPNVYCIGDCADFQLPNKSNVGGVARPRAARGDDHERPCAVAPQVCELLGAAGSRSGHRHC